VITGDNASALEEQVEGERFRRFPCAELAKRDELNLDIRWLKDASATDPDTCRLRGKSPQKSSTAWSWRWRSSGSSLPSWAPARCREAAQFGGSPCNRGS